LRISPLLFLSALLFTNALLIFFNIESVGSESKTWIVDDDGPADFHVIQEAIEAANLGDTIYVKIGTYHENILVDKKISLIGENCKLTVIDGGGKGDVIRVYHSACGSIIRNFTLKNSGTGDHAYSGAAINLWGAVNSLIENNIILENKIGISIYEGDYNTIRQNHIERNFDYGISIGGRYNLIIENNIVENFKAGIYLAFPCNNTIYHNNFVDNAKHVETW